MNQLFSFNTTATTSKQAVFMNKVYALMGLALLITGFVSWWASSTPGFLNLLYITDAFGNVTGINKVMFYGTIIAEFGLVWWLSSRIYQMSAERANLLFVVYAILNGITLSSIFIIYTASSIASTFFITAATFGVMSIYGYTTKKDLTSWGKILMMALIGLIIATVVNIFMQSTFLYFVTSYIGVLIFVGLTAYDTQKIKEMANQIGSEEDAKRGAVLGALTLYLDFVNLFLYLLRLFGDRRD